MIFNTLYTPFRSFAETMWSAPAALPVFEKIAQLAMLREGWYYGGGKAASLETVRIASELASAASKHGLTEIDAFPGMSGQLTIAVYEGDVNHSFQVQPNGRIEYWDEASCDSDEEELTRDDALKIIQNIAWNSSFTSTFGYGISERTIFEAKPLNLQVTEAEFPWSTESVFDAVMPPFVTTRASFIPRLVQSHQSSGDSILPVSQMEAA